MSDDLQAFSQAMKAGRGTMHRDGSVTKDRGGLSRDERGRFSGPGQTGSTANAPGAADIKGAWEPGKGSPRGPKSRPGDASHKPK